MQGGGMRRSAVATAIDDTAAYEKSDKSIWRLLNIRCTRIIMPLFIDNILQDIFVPCFYKITGIYYEQIIS